MNWRISPASCSSCGVREPPEVGGAGDRVEEHGQRRSERTWGQAAAAAASGGPTVPAARAPDHAGGRAGPVTGRLGWPGWPVWTTPAPRASRRVEAVRPGPGRAGRRAAAPRSRASATPPWRSAWSIGRGWRSPGRHPVRTAPALDVVQRFLERSVERRPSALGSIGLNALQLLAYEHPVDGKPDTPPDPGRRSCSPTSRASPASPPARGDEAALELLADHHRVVGPIVRSRGGRVVKRLGDGLMLSFPSAEAAVHGARSSWSRCRPSRAAAAGRGPLRRGGGHAPTTSSATTSTSPPGWPPSAKGGQVLATVGVRDAVGELRGVALRAGPPPQLQGRRATRAGVPGAAQWLTTPTTSRACSTSWPSRPRPAPSPARRSTAAILDAVVADLRGRWASCADLLTGRGDDPLGSALALRFLGAVHRIVLDGPGPGAGRVLPVGGRSRPSAIPAPAFLRHGARRTATRCRGASTTACRPTRSGRSAVLVGGFAAVAAAHRPAAAGARDRRQRRPEPALGPLRLRHRAGGGGRPGQPGALRRGVGGRPARAAGHVRGGRAGRLRPQPDRRHHRRTGRLTLQSFVWPDQIERLARLEAAIEVAAGCRPRSSRPTPATWVADRLAEPLPGAGHRRRALDRAAVPAPRASGPASGRPSPRPAAGPPRAAPLAWLRMEPGGDRAELRLTTWPGGEERCAGAGTTVAHRWDAPA